jgi:inner membrane protease ATP23
MFIITLLIIVLSSTIIFLSKKIRAASLSGDCHFTKEFMRGHWKIRKQHQECVKRRVYLSLTANPHCHHGEDIKKVVEDVFETCLADTQPFDRIP